MHSGADPTDTEVVVVGAGLAGLVAAAELADAGKRVVLLEQEPEASLGGQAPSWAAASSRGGPPAGPWRPSRGREPVTP